MAMYGNGAEVCSNDPGVKMRIKQAENEDAEKLLAAFRMLDSETKFMLFEPGERKTTVPEQVDIIQKYNASPSKRMLIAIDGQSDEIMGFVVGIGNELQRNKHTLYCVVGVLQRYAGNGVGKALLQNLEEWAKESGFHRLELTVMEHNERAKRLYGNLGFQSEGIRRDSLKVDGKFINEIYMSKLV